MSNKRVSPSPENIRSALAAISPDLARDVWVAMAMAIKSELQDEGFDLFDEWSRGGQTYNAADARSTWKSIKPEGGITVATLFHHAMQNGWTANLEGLTEFVGDSRDHRNIRQEEALNKAEHEAAKHAAAAKDAAKIYELSVEGPHKYLQDKGVSGVPGLRVIEFDAAQAIRSFGPKICPTSKLLLLTPMFAPNAELCGLHAIDEHGGKGFLAGCKKGLFMIGESTAENSGIIAVTEGLATALSVHEATGIPVLVAFDASGLKSAAMRAKSKYPAAFILICGDLDENGTGKRKAEAAAEIVGGHAVLPSFSGLNDGGVQSDFNDLHRVAALGAVKSQINNFVSDVSAKMGVNEPSRKNISNATDNDSSLPELLQNLPEKIKNDPSYPLKAEVLRELVILEETDPYHLNQCRSQIKSGGVAFKTLEQSMRWPRKARRDELTKTRPGMAQQNSVDGSEHFCRIGQYAIMQGCIYRFKETANGEITIRLCNFSARIIKEVLRDDGVNEEGYFVIEGHRADGRPLKATEVSFSEFGSMAWITHAWGNQACIEAGLSTRDHLRSAIQSLSGDVPRQTIYGHIGWRNIDGEWRYLHGSGALGANDNRTDIQVDAGAGNMIRYRFPDGVSDARNAVRASLRLLEISPNNPVLGTTLLAAVYRAPLAQFAGIDVSLLLTGLTGTQKSESSAVALQHFGSCLSARSLPGTWGDTAADLEMKAHAAKDAIFVIDDFKPNGKPKSEADRLHSLADRIFRSVGNGVARGRRQANLKQRPDYPVRGFIVATGEDIPRGQSCRARLMIVEVKKGDIDKSILSELQEAANTGLLAQAMTAYIQWLAPRIPTLESKLREALLQERLAASQAGLASDHDRVPDNVAQVMVGIRMLMRFAGDIHSIDDVTGEIQRLRTIIYSAAMSQGEHLKDQDETYRFFSLLRSVLSSRRAHVLDIHSLDAPFNARVWGWKIVENEYEGEIAESKTPGGNPIGWLEGDKLYLEAGSAFAAVVMMAKDQGESFSITERALWNRFASSGLLLERKADKRKDGTRYLRLFCEKRIGEGKPAGLICLAARNVLEEAFDQSAETAETE